MRTEKIGNYQLNAWAVQAASKWLGYWNVFECMPGNPCRLIEECADGVYGFESSAELDAILEALQFIKFSVKPRRSVRGGKGLLFVRGCMQQRALVE